MIIEEEKSILPPAQTQLSQPMRTCRVDNSRIVLVCHSAAKIEGHHSYQVDRRLKGVSPGDETPEKEVCQASKVLREDMTPIEQTAPR